MTDTDTTARTPVKAITKVTPRTPKPAPAVQAEVMPKQTTSRKFIAETPVEIKHKTPSEAADFQADAIANTGLWAILSTGTNRPSTISKASKIRKSHGVWAGNVWEAKVTQNADPALFDLWVRHMSAS